MTLFTPVYAFPYPEPTDAPDGPTQIHNLALGVEAQLVTTNANVTKALTVPVPQVFTTNGTVTAASVTGAVALRIEGCNGGGGGGGAATTGVGQSAAGGPACGGASAIRTISMSGLVFPLQVNVGAAGTAGAAGNNAGGVGGTSSVKDNNGAGTTIWTPGTQSANQKGLGGAALASIGDASTPGFDGSTTGGVGDVLIPGQQPGGVATRYGAATCTRPFAGGSLFGAGGVPGNNTAGSAGLGFGGGGGGGYVVANTGQVAGGAGAPGVVLVTPLY